MMNLVLLATVFIILNGFVHSCHVSDSLETVNRPRKSFQGLRTYLNGTQSVLEYIPQTTKPEIYDEISNYDIITEPPKREMRQDTKTKQNNKRESWNSKLDQLKKWTLSRKENQVSPLLYILRTNNI